MSAGPETPERAGLGAGHSAGHSAGEGHEPEELGLRERKRLATRQALQRAVLDLAAEQGFDAVTIEGISSAAGVSPRTFFNYFASKEEAVMGDLPSLVAPEGSPTAAAAADFLAGGGTPSEAGILPGIGRVLEAAVSAVPGDREGTQRRRMLLRQHPALFTRRMAYLHEFEDDLTDLIAQRLRRTDAALAADPPALARRARLLSLIAYATMRHAYAGWTEGDGSRALVDHLREAFTELGDVLA